MTNPQACAGPPGLTDLDVTLPPWAAAHGYYRAALRA